MERRNQIRGMHRVLFACALSWCTLVSVRPISALNPDLRISQYAHTAWRMQDGAFPSPHGTIAQTADGYLWITTKQGLFRFDGVRFSPWEPPPGTRQLPTKDVRSLLADRDGSLWIGTAGGIAHLLAGKLITFPKVEGVVEQIIQDSQGTIWFTRGQRGPEDTEGPLCDIRATELLCHGQNDGVPFRDAQALAEDRDGAIWAGSSTQLIRWKDGKLLD